MTEFTLTLEEPLEYRVASFKNDADKMKQVNDFLDDILFKARIEAESKINHKQKGKSVSTIFVSFCFLSNYFLDVFRIRSDYRVSGFFFNFFFLVN